MRDLGPWNVTVFNISRSDPGPSCMHMKVAECHGTGSRVLLHSTRLSHRAAGRAISGDFFGRAISGDFFSQAPGNPL